MTSDVGQDPEPDQTPPILIGSARLSTDNTSLLIHNGRARQGSRREVPKRQLHHLPTSKTDHDTLDNRLICFLTKLSFAKFRIQSFSDT